MKDFIEACVFVVRKLTGYELSPDYIPYAVLALTVVPLMLSFYFLVRRWSGDFNAISSEMRMTADLISNETKTEIGGLLKKFETLNEDLKRTVVGKIDLLQILLKSTDEVQGRQDDELIAPDLEPVQSRQTRVTLAEQVRNAVVDKWLDGRFLTQEKPSCFRYEGTTEAGTKIKLYFQTPYRESVGEDGRLPFTLEVWVNNYKHLNFERDSEGKYALRGFKKGEWIGEVATWQFLAGRTQRQVA